ncbi:MAG TPA: CBS domain-containing protein [Kouleothrix sp.]|uniref:CBS domain-containing protein n=1 Tax=Kouleothrix sp. TaxID=2779161 RepID=UPI002D065508|nr:CBS domain-containing protein [Kouleothrix sp.]HRC77884.1 CBS domain-containing protein [Kouleothrix sp.]
MRVADRMSTPPVTIVPDMNHHAALRLMQEHGMHHLPVVDRQGHLVGIVAERDLLLAVAHYVQTPIEISEVMQRNVFTVAADTLLTEAATLMVRHKIGGLPVVDAEQQIVGVITETDIFKAFVAMLEEGQDFTKARGS